jgi:hypothetical protein
MKVMYFVFACLLLAGCEQRRAPEVREFPDGFHGWAVIVWNVPNYSQIPIEHGKLIERFFTNGVIVTSSKQQFGWAHDEAYFVDGAGHRLTVLPNTPFGAVGHIQQGARNMDYFQQFVGTEAEHKAAPIEAPQIQTLFNKLYPESDSK